MFLENLGHNWDSRVDRVGDNKDKSLRSSNSNSGCKVPDDSRIDLIRRSAISFFGECHTTADLE